MTTQVKEPPAEISKKEIKLRLNKDKQETTKNEIIEVYMSFKYDFRFNTIKCKPEYRFLDKNDWQPVDKYFLNSIKREMDANNKLLTSPENIKQILESTFSPRINPIQEYFKTLPRWDQRTDYIQQLADTVKVKNTENWYLYLRRWLIATIANAMTDIGCQNHTCLVLTGGQGKFKTTWLDNLCPGSLSRYMFTGKIDPTQKDALTYIAEFLFINIDDQLRQLNRKDENELKNLITTPSVKYRRPYDPYITDYPHTASFMASVNGNDFLTDPSGSRRFLPFEVIQIDIDAAQKMNLDQVYSQAYSLYKSKERYWFNFDEIDDLHKQNQQFQVISTEEQLLLEYFDRPDNRAGANCFLQSAKIQSIIEKDSSIRLNAKKLGEALSKLDFEKWQKTEDKHTRWVWSMIQKEGEWLNTQNEVKVPY